jgi:polar amino acid transport system substrate-binding protein
MKQLIQNFKSGELYVDDVPVPSISDGFVLVENKFSLISSGTERGTVKVAQASLLGKARQRPDLVAQVLNNIRKEGLAATLRKVQTKLDTLKALGYSSAGVVLSSLDKNGHFRPGDRVACAGQDYASHAEMVAVPQNLVARIPDNVSFEEASFTTLGAIALQGVRQAEPTLGDRVCVIGLGLLGQLTCQLLRANGCHVFGVDLSPRLVDLARKHSADAAHLRSDPMLMKEADQFSRGRGFDSVIITAAAPSNDPIELAAELSRKKGKVIVVGSVKMDVPRDPHFYRKELDLRMSCSYGPGRYDSGYEEDGQDYPFAYVRWTEQRNMEAFLDLVSKGSVNVRALITHTFEVDQAVEAFELVTGKRDEPSVGILLKYPEREGKATPRTVVHSPTAGASEVTVGFIGAGSFAQSYLLPGLKNNTKLKTVVTTRGITAKNVAEKFGFEVASSSADEVFLDTSVNTVFIATPHNSHASLAEQALRNGKNVFVEKPLAIHRDEMHRVITAAVESNKLLMVGFNRRFSPLSETIRHEVASGAAPVLMNFRVNAGVIPKDHWIQKPEIGGGRILGEMCHFIDLMIYFSGSSPDTVYASTIRSGSEKDKDEDTIVVTVNFHNGSMGVLTYVAVGDASLPKEHLEVYSGGRAGVINDFRFGTLHVNNKQQPIKKSGKGHREEVAAFLKAVKSGGQPPIPLQDIFLTTEACFCILDSLATGLPQAVQVNLPA